MVLGNAGKSRLSSVSTLPLKRTERSRNQKHVIRFALLLLILSIDLGCGGPDSSGSGPGGNGGNPGNPNDAKLNGTYSFSISEGIVGSFQADGKGNITGGEEDLNLLDAMGNPVHPALVKITGTYTLGANGKGTLTLNSSAVNRTLSIVLVSSKQALILGFDDFKSPTTGQVDLQDPSTFSLTTLASHSYAFLDSTTVGAFSAN